MADKVKNYVGFAAIFALVVFALSAVGYVKTYSKSIEPSRYRSFSVSGEGKVVAIPDIAQFSFTVITEGGTDLSVLQTENSAKINNAIDFIKSNGVEDADIKTQSYNVSPRYQYFDCSPRILRETLPYPATPDENITPCPPPEIVGYTINQTVSIKVRDFEKIGALLSGVVKNGANLVYGPNFTIDDRTKIENEARAKAIENAKQKADAVAKAGGFRLGRILAINEGGYSPYPRYESFSGFDYGKGGGGDVPAPTIEPGSQDVIVNVSISYEIK